MSNLPKILMIIVVLVWLVCLQLDVHHLNGLVITEGNIIDELMTIEENREKSHD